MTPGLRKEAADLTIWETLEHRQGFTQAECSIAAYLLAHGETLDRLTIRQKRPIPPTPPSSGCAGGWGSAGSGRCARCKANTVERTGHCSLWALAKAEAEGSCNDLFREENDCLPVGGAFPIFEDGADGQMTALVMTSGLHHGKDHEAVVKALCTVQKKPMPAYHGPLV